MLPTLQATSALMPGMLRLGRLRLSVYGVFAAMGLVAALWLSQKTAKRVGLSPDRLWDAGMFAVIAAFVASRVLLVMTDLHLFLRYPLLMMSLPSLTYTGMLVTGVLTWLYLRWKRLPLLDVLDAWAPCAALLAAVLSVGHFVEGTDAGMPTTLPWGVVTPGDAILGKVHPVELYEAALAGVLGVWFWRRLTKREYGGEVVVTALLSGGLAAYLLDFLRQPVETFSEAWLDPAQFVALAAMLAGLVCWQQWRGRLIGTEAGWKSSDEVVQVSLKG